MLLTSLQLLPASFENLEQVHSIYLNCRAYLFQNSLYQWDNTYPNKDYFRQCIEDRTLQLLKKDDKTLGFAVLNEEQAEEWRVISWTGANPLVLHALMLDPAFQGHGLGKAFIARCEQAALSGGYRSIRLDAFSENQAAVRLYEKMDYQIRGRVSFSSKPEGHQEYICFEKEL